MIIIETVNNESVSIRVESEIQIFYEIFKEYYERNLSEKMIDEAVEKAMDEIFPEEKKNEFSGIFIHSLKEEADNWYKLDPIEMELVQCPEQLFTEEIVGGHIMDSIKEFKKRITCTLNQRRWYKGNEIYLEYLINGNVILKNIAYLVDKDNLVGLLEEYFSKNKAEELADKFLPQTNPRFVYYVDKNNGKRYKIYSTIVIEEDVNRSIEDIKNLIMPELLGYTDPLEEIATKIYDYLKKV